MSGTRLKTVQFAIVLILAAVLGGVTTYFSMRDQVYTYEYTSGTGAAGSAQGTVLHFGICFVPGTCKIAKTSGHKDPNTSDVGHT